ncbi:MAG: hypothetical protein M3Z85_11240 [Acidobacteriota bacterium]|nr:hypothetical protein [Acidobacteriota bacterium]
MLQEEGKTQARWALTADGFQRLLSRLSEDPEAAAREFESLRRKLINIFAYEGCRDPEQAADTVLDRMAKRLSEGEVIEKPERWLRGAAKFVLRELRLEYRQEVSGIRQMPPPDPAPQEAERNQECLEHCLGLLPVESRNLVERYYRSEGARSLIQSRKALASELGISVEALRTRVLRLRKDLETCVVEYRKEREHNSPI